MSAFAFFDDTKVHFIAKIKRLRYRILRIMYIFVNSLRRIYRSIKKGGLILNIYRRL